MPTLSAAAGSFHVKSSSTSFVVVFETILVLPFRLTLTFICSGTLSGSIFRLRSYSDQRERSMQLGVAMHSSTRATAVLSIELGSTEFVPIQPAGISGGTST